MTTDREVLLGLGSNTGNRRGYLTAAVAELQHVAGFRPDRVSGLYETEPVGDVPQSDFLNMALRGWSRLPAERLLEQLLALEQRLGRVRSGPKGGPRVIDIDLLYVGDCRVQSASLELPHPRLYDRRFVLEPLCEIAPDFLDPVRNLRVREMLALCADRHAVARLHDPVMALEQDT